MTSHPAIIPSYLVLCLLLGGASSAGLLANAFLQLLAIPLIVAALLAARPSVALPAPRSASLLLWLLVAIFIWQLAPLPPELWTTLPGRDRIADGLGLLGQPLPWLPVSLDPGRTVAAALWLLPPIAIFLAMLRRGAFKNAWLAWSLIAVSCMSVLLGAIQMTGGEASPAYLYEITNFGLPTGFFANVNHQATMLLCTIPFLTALFVRYRARTGGKHARSGYVLLVASAAAVLTLGILLSGSLAAWGLYLPVLGASAMMVWGRKRRISKWAIAAFAVAAAAAVAGSFATPFGNNLTTQEAREDVESRYTSFTRSAGIAADHMPVGTGAGTFPKIYPWYEEPGSVTMWYMNHVHNDYIEVVLETGLPGLLLILLFLIWWLSRTAAIWRAPEPDSFAQAATIASAAILAHSLVDYPLRTASVASVFALCCALMAEARPAMAGERRGGLQRARHLTA